MPRQKSDLPPLEKKRVTSASMSRELKIMAMTSLGFVGGVKYLEKVAKTNPSAYLAFLAKTLVVKDATEEVGDTTFVVRTLNIIAQPTPGVINSPVAGHIAEPRLIARSGEIIDNEPAARHG
jgi:hypothetical protein